MKVQRLFTIRVLRPGDTDQRCSDAQLVPRAGHASGSRALARHGMLARLGSGSIEIAAQVVEGVSGPKPLRPWSGNDVLGFDLRASTANFAALADLSAWERADLPVYRNGPDRRLRLADDTGPVRPAPTARADGVLARIEIGALQAGWLKAAPDFTLQLPARQMSWVYYLIARRPHLGTPRVEATGGAPAFTAKLITASNTPAAVDPIGRELAGRHPTGSCWRLMSRRALSMPGQSGVRLSLFMGDELLLAQLPRPSLHSATRVAVGSTGPRPALFRVVEY